jgi:hypothetical protein
MNTAANIQNNADAPAFRLAKQELEIPVYFFRIKIRKSARERQILRRFACAHGSETGRRQRGEKMSYALDPLNLQGQTATITQY